jgi:hypothetical protein
MKARFLSLVFVSLALTACGGGGLTKLLGVPPIPTPSPSPAIQVTPSSITLAAGASATITASESAANAFFTAQSTDTTVATVTQATSQNSFVVSAVKAGKCSVLVTDAFGTTVTVSVSVH